MAETTPRGKARAGPERTTVSLAAPTRDRLRSQGRKGETYDDLVNRLLNELEAVRARLAETVEFEPVSGRRG